MTIHHLVIGGGGLKGLCFYGILKQLSIKNFWNIKNIKTIYSCSAGGYVGFILSLNYDFDWIDDYIIKRPWDKLVALKPTTILNTWLEKGLVGEEIAIEIIKPLLGAKSLNLNITLKELFEFTGIEQHFYTTNLNGADITKVDLNYKTHPDLELYKALAMTSALPIFFKPIFIDNGCFVDGGIVNNFPLNDCLDETGCNDDDVLAIRECSKSKTTIDSETTIYSYLLRIVFSMARLISNDNNQKIVKNSITYYAPNFDVNFWKDTLSNETNRSELVECGLKLADEFLAAAAETATECDDIPIPVPVPVGDGL